MFNIDDLLQMDESPTLEFKQEWYKLAADSPEAARRGKGELIKDILALANGNTDFAGEPAYLVIGVSDEKDVRGWHKVIGVSEQESIHAEHIREIVNNYCSPRLDHLTSTVYPVSGKNIVVLTIHPTPHIHETTKKLDTPKRSYDEYAVFVRHGSEIRLASTRERVALEQIKRLRFAERRNVDPVACGALTGGLLGAIFVKYIAEKTTDEGTSFAGTVAGALTGSLLGGLWGGNYRDMRDIFYEIRQKFYAKRAKRIR